MRHSIEMRADHDDRQGRIPSRLCHKEIANKIRLQNKSQDARHVGEARMRHALARTEGGAADARRIERVLAQVIEKVCRDGDVLVMHQVVGLCPHLRSYSAAANNVRKSMASFSGGASIINRSSIAFK